MVSIVTKRIKGNDYLYLVESIREGTRVRQRTVKYLGKKRLLRKEEIECIERSHRGEDRILTQAKDTLPYTTHVAMRRSSRNHYETLKALPTIARKKEEERFLSAFIANSNAIEGSTMTPKDTYEYLFNDTPPSRKARKELVMADNLLRAWNYMYKNKKRRVQKEDLYALHALVNKDIEDEETIGKYKNIQNYIGDVYTTAPQYVQERMRELLTWIHQAEKTVDDFEIAFQSHAQFEVIHPFIDGNGRIGRLLMNWILLHKSLAPLAIPAAKRAEYIQALENSRRGKTEAITKFLSQTYLEQYTFF